VSVKPGELDTIRDLERALARLATGRFEFVATSVPESLLYLPEAPPSLRVPAKHPGFGDLAVYVEPEEMRVDIGFFTHVHCMLFRDELKKDRVAEIDRAAWEVIDLLDDIVSERRIAYRGKSIGGTFERSGSPSWFARRLSDGVPWSWSGPLSAEEAQRLGFRPT
jgi:hypothetical protein